MNKLFFCEGISKNYEEAPVVQDISLELAAGGFVSLLGPSGTGKTTLFNVLSGVDMPDTGRVILDGEDITGISGKVSYMLQKDLLLEYRTVIDNVILPLLLNGKKKNEAREYASGFFNKFGLSGYEKKYPNELSGGMRQRAALLRTCMNLSREMQCDERVPLLARSSVILLDEPFSALDAITRHTMQTWYAGIAGEMKFSTLFITHDVEEALILSDTVYIMNGKPGRITHNIDVYPNKPRNAGFAVSKEFVDQKRCILESIVGAC